MNEYIEIELNKLTKAQEYETKLIQNYEKEIIEKNSFISILATRMQERAELIVVITKGINKDEK